MAPLKREVVQLEAMLSLHQSRAIQHARASCSKEPRADFIINSFDGKLLDVMKPYILRKGKKFYNDVMMLVKHDKVTKKFHFHDLWLENFNEFFSPEVTGKAHNRNYQMAKQLFIEQLPKANLQRIVVKEDTEFDEIFSNRRSIACFTAPGKTKYQVWGEIREYLLALQSLDFPEFFRIPSQALERTQISNFVVDGEPTPELVKHKDRLVNGNDAVTVGVEGLFVRPLMSKVFSKVQQYAGSKNDTDISIILRNWKLQKHWASIDYSQFDATLPSWLIKDCFDILKMYFPVSEHHIIDWISERFIHTDLAVPGRGIVRKHKGIPSGSYFTQIIGSMANSIMLLTYMFSKYKGDREEVLWDLRAAKDRSDTLNLTFITMGDDNLIFTRKPLDLQDMSKYVKHMFGVKIKPEKCDVGSSSNPPKFLKREWRDHGCYRDPLELIVNMLHPERVRRYEEGGFEPEHVLYGYFLTYYGAMRQVISDLEMSMMLQNSSAGFEGLNAIPFRDLPGTLKYQIITGAINREKATAYMKDALAFNSTNLPKLPKIPA